MNEAQTVGVRCISMGNTPSRQENVALARLIGARMREAREMVGLSQLNAAKQLGYVNSSKLAKIEGGKGCSGDATAVHCWVIKRAARIYDVSIDYLMGNSGTMERDDVDHAALREMHALLLADFDRHRARDVLAMDRLRGRIVEVERLLTKASESATYADEARVKIEASSKPWQEVKGGASWAAATERTATILHTATPRFASYREDVRAAQGQAPHFDLVLE